jgi:hypothetical protein
VNFTPDPPSGGTAPYTLNANMCPTVEPEGERLIFEFKWGGAGRSHFSYFCRDSHTYTQPGRYRAWFCAHDDHDNHSCHNVTIDVF